MAISQRTPATTAISPRVLPNQATRPMPTAFPTYSPEGSRSPAATIGSHEPTGSSAPLLEGDSGRPRLYRQGERERNDREHGRDGRSLSQWRIHHRLAQVPPCGNATRRWVDSVAGSRVRPGRRRGTDLRGSGIWVASPSTPTGGGRALWPRDDNAEIVECGRLALGHEPVGLPLARAETAARLSARPTVQGEANLAARLQVADDSLSARLELGILGGEELDSIGLDAPTAFLSPDGLDEIHGPGWAREDESNQSECPRLG